MKRAIRRGVAVLLGLVLSVSVFAGQGAVVAEVAASTRTRAAGTSAGDGVAISTQTAGASAAASERAGYLEPTPGTSVTLRISNWEEYIDEGGWGDDEVIDLESGDIFGESSMVDDFSQWYEETYDVTVTVEYSTVGTNEGLYNMLTLGDTFDLIGPSEYMFTRLFEEGRVRELSEGFHDPDVPHNYYAQGLSPYIRQIFTEQTTNGKPWADFAAGYMWGVTGILYNPEEVAEEDASTWQILNNPDYFRQVTIKDNSRDAYFAAVAALERDLLTSEEFLNDPNYQENLEDLMNDTSPERIQQVQDYLQDVKDNVYAFEVDSGKSDMAAGRVLANYQWSGDAIYAMDEAEADDLYLNFAVPEEVTNIYFDAWVMLEDGIAGDEAKQHAAEAFINFVSRPDNVVRNMYYIGYTSVISGGEDGRVMEYLQWNYESEEEEAIPYDISYFFAEEPEAQPDAYVIMADEDQVDRQLAAQYPQLQLMERASIMRNFGQERNRLINDMWVNVRCFHINDLPWWAWALTAAMVGALVYLGVRKVRKGRVG